MIQARHLTKRYGKAVAVDGVSSGRLDPQSAAGLIAGSALGALADRAGGLRARES